MFFTSYSKYDSDFKPVFLDYLSKNNEFFDNSIAKMTSILKDVLAENRNVETSFKILRERDVINLYVEVPGFKRENIKFKLVEKNIELTLTIPEDSLVREYYNEDGITSVSKLIFLDKHIPSDYVLADRKIEEGLIKFVFKQDKSEKYKETKF